MSMSLTLKEIEGQFAALEKTIGAFRGAKARLLALYEQQPPEKLVCIGCGSSYELACSLRNIAYQRLSIPCAAYAAGDVWMHAADYRRDFENAWVICISRSGQTTEVLRAGQALLDMGINARLLSIICADDTPLERLSVFTLRLPWAFDESVCQTRSVTNLFAAGAMMMDCLGGKEELEQRFEQLSGIGGDLLERARPLAKKVAQENWSRAVVLADGPADGLAAECALAFKEISQQEGYTHHVLDVRHGPMVLIRANTLVLVWLPNAGGIPQQIRDLLGEIRANGARLLCVTEFEENVDGALNLAIGQQTGAVAGCVALAVMCQLIAYEKSFYAGCNPDQPDGLTAWIHIQ